MFQIKPKPSLVYKNQKDLPVFPPAKMLSGRLPSIQSLSFCSSDFSISLLLGHQGMHLSQPR